MRVSHSFPAISTVFDDANLVSCAGLAPTMALAHRAGLGDLVADTLTLKSEGGVNAHLKVAALLGSSPTPWSPPRLVAGAGWSPFAPTARTTDTTSLLRPAAGGVGASPPYPGPGDHRCAQRRGHDREQRIQPFDPGVSVPGSLLGVTVGGFDGVVDVDVAALDGARTPVNNRPIPPCRRRSMSSMQSAPATIPATSAGTFRCAFTPPSDFNVRVSATRSPTP